VRFSLGGSRQVLSDQRLLEPGSGQLRAAIGGPTLAAGFYRRDVLAALGGFDEAATDRLADASFALDVAALDLRAELQPNSRIEQVADGLQAAPEWSLARGRAAERLFWRRAAGASLPLALATHALAVTLDCLANISQVGGLLLGRLVALCEVGGVKRNEARLTGAVQKLKAAAAERKAAQRQPLRRAA
jgi:hypothetical protein